MKTSLLALALVCGLASAQSVEALWTGAAQQGTSVTGQPGWSCEYDYNGRRFWRFFPDPIASGGCPASVRVS